MQVPDRDLVARRVQVQGRILRRPRQARGDVHGAATARRQEAGPGEPLQLKFRHGEICLDRTIEHAAQVRPLAERARQIEGNLCREGKSGLAVQLDGAVERGRALLDHESGPRIHLLDGLGAQIVRLDGHGCPWGRQAPAGDDASVDHAASALLLQGGQLCRLGQPGEVELRQPRLELDGRVGRLRSDGLYRQLTLKIDADDPASGRPTIGLQDAAAEVGMNVPVDGKISGRPRSRAADVGAHIEVRDRAWSFHDRVRFQHAVKSEVLRHHELGKPIQLEIRDHHRRVDPAGRRLDLRLQAHAAVIAHQLDGLEHHRIAEVDVRIAREMEDVSRIGDEEVRQGQAVLVFIDLRIAGELENAPGHRGVDSKARERPLQRHFDPRRAQIDRACGEPLRRETQRAVRPLQRPMQRAIDGQAVGGNGSAPEELRRAQAHRCIGRGGRARHARGQPRGSADGQRRLPQCGADRPAEVGQVRGAYVEIEGNLVVRSRAVGLDLEPERGGGEGAHDRVPPHQGGLHVRDHRTDAVEPRRTDVQRELLLAHDAVLVESGRSFSMQGEASGHLAFRRPVGESCRIDGVGGELDVPDRSLLQCGGQLRSDPAASGFEPEVHPCRLSIALHIELATQGGGERRFPRNHRHVFRPYDQLANPDFAGPPGDVPGSVRDQAALAELRAEGLERDRPRRPGALERRIEIDGDRRFSRSGQLGGETQRRRRGIRRVTRVRIGDVEIAQRQRRVRSELRPDGDGPAAKLEVAHVDLPLERTSAGLRRLARLDRALQGRLPGTGNLRDLDPGSLELRLGDDHPVRLQGQWLQPDAGAVGVEHAMPVGIAQVHAVHADLQEPADVDGADAQVALDCSTGLVRDVLSELCGTPSGMQPDERCHDRQGDDAEEREHHDPDDPPHLPPTRLQVARLPLGQPRRLVPRFWQMLRHRSPDSCHRGASAHLEREREPSLAERE